MSEEMEYCSNCGRAIGKLEQAYVYKGNVVCQQCNKLFATSSLQKTPKPRNVVILTIACLSLIISICAFIYTAYIDYYLRMRYKMVVPEMTLFDKELGEFWDISEGMVGGANEADLAEAARVSQEKKKEEARQKTVLIKDWEEEIAQRESVLVEREKEVDDAEKKIVQMRKEQELKAQAMFYNSEIDREISRSEKGRQLIQEYWGKYDKAEEEFDEILTAQRKEIVENWRYIEYLRSCLRILKSTDDPELASKLINIEIGSYDNITELQNDYEKIEARQEKGQARRERVIKRKLERELAEIERKYR